MCVAQSVSLIPRRRSRARYKVDWPAVALFGWVRIPCEVVDVSRGGAKVRASAEVPAHSPVTLLCEKFGSLEGCLIWRRGDLAGIQFTDPGAAAILQPFLRAADDAPVVTVKFGRRPPLMGD